jgi:hypothetical protein
MEGCPSSLDVPQGPWLRKRVMEGCPSSLDVPQGPLAEEAREEGCCTAAQAALDSRTCGPVGKPRHARWALSPAIKITKKKITCCSKSDRHHGTPAQGLRRRCQTRTDVLNLADGGQC